MREAISKDTSGSRPRLRCGLLWGLVAAGAIGLPAGRAGSEAPQSLPNPLPLSWCLETAESANPTLARDQAAVAAARHRIVPAGALDDPRFGLDAVNLPTSSFDLNSTPMSGLQLGLRQKFPFPGVLSNRERAARAAAAAEDASLGDRRRRVATEVEQRWVELGFAQRALEITEANLDLMRQLAKIAETKYRVGTGLQADVLRAQVAVTDLLDQHLRRVSAIRSAEAGLGAVLDLAPATHFSRTEDLNDDSPVPELEPLIAGLAETSPLLAAHARRVEEAERLRRASVREGYPAFDVGLGYRLRQRSARDPVAGDDFLSVGVTVRLPVNRHKWRERIAERGALVRRAKASLRAARARLRGTTRSAHAELERADAAVSLLRTGLVPQTRQSLDSSRSGYRVDQVDFLSLIDSQVRMLDAELSLVRAMADRRAAFAALEVAVGEELR